MTDNKNTTYESNASIEKKTTYSDETLKDYNQKFLPGVHVWGRITMVIGFIMTFSPAIYLYFVKGYRESADTYANVVLAVVAFAIGLWLTEPLSYFPVLGSAGTYMSYFSGNVGSMRTPVALSVQNMMKEDSTTPRGNLATIFALVASVVTNLVILAIIVLLGSFIIKLLPENVKLALKFVLPALYGSLITMQLMSKPKLVATYAIPTVIFYLLVGLIPVLHTISLPIVMAATILFGYIKFRNNLKNTK